MRATGIMIGEAESQISRALLGVLPESYSKPRWYVAQTRSRHEKSVAAQLNERGVEHFLPLYEAVSRWKDRRVRLQLPLFAGYIFVRMPLRERLRALEIPSIVRLVGFGGLPIPMPDDEMEAMRNGLTIKLRVEPHPYLTAGRRARIKSGPLAGLGGILLRKKGSFRFVLSVELIQRAVITDVNIADIEPVH
jgi:transcription antitermination factor NusG